VVAANDRKAFSDEAQELRASEAWKAHLHMHRSIIVDLFQGQLRSTLKCLKCKQVSITFDCFMYLSVPIPQKRKG
jgi:ubiquitin C-terminal hydrolase